MPRTLFGRILVAMFCGLLAVQAVGVWLMLDERARFGERLIGEYVAQRIAGILTVLDDALPSDRPRLVRALSTPAIRISLDEPWQAAGTDRTEDARTFIGRIERDLDRPMKLQVISFLRADNVPWRKGSGPYLIVNGQAQFRSGAVVTFRRTLPQSGLDWPMRALALLGVFGLFVAFMAGWAVRRVTRPLATLADAASGLARNLDRPPLPETGPQEVGRAAQAFNAMQHDLKRMLETRAQALAGVSHDLRLPLTRMRLRLERLPEGELRSKIESDLQEMEAMIASTLEFLGAGEGGEKRVRLNLDALLEGVAEDMQALGAQVNVDGRCRAPIVAQPHALRRCIDNLIDNAYRYGGREIGVLVEDSEERVAIRIQDRGPGIPAADRDRVFEPYVRLEASRAKHTGGTGLGLAIARAIARAGGGDISFEAREGGGLVALLTLPRTAAVVPDT